MDSSFSYILSELEWKKKPYPGLRDPVKDRPRWEKCIEHLRSDDERKLTHPKGYDLLSKQSRERMLKSFCKEMAGALSSALFGVSNG